ncbi:MAG: ELM1/GtrOC1 family putative glycosyltransferase, partial [Pseudomonadota bacterium]
MSRTPLQPQPIEGSRAWVITDGKAGSESQARGIADGLELDWRLIRVAPTGLTKLIAPFGRPNRADRFGEPGSVFAPPWPDIAIAIGRRSMPYLRAVKRAHAATVTIALLDPKAGLGVADLIWVPEHDKLRGPNVITTLTAPHGFSPRRLAELRAHPPHAIA